MKFYLRQEWQTSPISKEMSRHVTLLILLKIYSKTPMAGKNYSLFESKKSAENHLICKIAHYCTLAVPGKI